MMGLPDGAKRLLRTCLLTALGLLSGMPLTLAAPSWQRLTVANFSGDELEVSSDKHVERSSGRVEARRSLQRWTTEGQAWRVRRVSDGREICSFVTRSGVTTVTIELPQPPTDWSRETIAGFQVFLSPELNRHSESAERARGFMRARLDEISRIVPPAISSSLKKVPFWLALDGRQGTSPFYANSPASPHMNAFHGAMYKGVVLPNIVEIMERYYPVKPMVVMHELAHAYHYQVLGHWNPEIKQAYEAAKARGLYANIEGPHGKRRPLGYALTNEHEYFAELSEAFWGRNDQFPFTKNELRSYDPEGYRIVELAWSGLLRSADPGGSLACRSSAPAM